MKCVVCKNGETEKGHTTVTLTKGDSVIVFKNVPADICLNCGEEYVSDETSAALLKVAHALNNAGVKVDIRDYKAA